MSFRGATIMFGTATDPSEGGYAEIAKPPGSSSIYVVIDDADALHERVVAAGGDIAMPLTDPTTARATSRSATRRATSGTSGRMRH